jgi:hypothetical protein
VDDNTRSDKVEADCYFRSLWASGNLTFGHLTIGLACMNAAAVPGSGVRN